MGVRWHFDGLSEFEQALRNLPRKLQGEANTIVRGRANLAATLIIRKYPERTYGRTRGRGNLRAGVAVEEELTTSGIRMTVRQSAKHAWIFENGTETRQTTLGADRGKMPPGHVFLPIIIDQRAKMEDDLADMLERNGLLVLHRAA